MNKRIAPSYLRKCPDMSEVFVKVKGKKPRFKGMIAKEMKCVIALTDVGGFEMWAEIPFEAVSYFKKKVHR